MQYQQENEIYRVKIVRILACFLISILSGRKKKTATALEL